MQDEKHQIAIAFVDSAIECGKPISAVRCQIIAQHILDRKRTEDFVNAMPSIAVGAQLSDGVCSS